MVYIELPSIVFECNIKNNLVFHYWYKSLLHPSGPYCHYLRANNPQTLKYRSGFQSSKDFYFRVWLLIHTVVFIASSEFTC